MFRKVSILSFGLILSLAGNTFADEETRRAVKQTQDDLRKPGIAQEAAKMSPEAKQAAKQVKGLSGGSEANEQAIYGLTADVLGNMKDMTPEQMEQVVGDAAKDPEGFAKKWTPEQRKRLKEISDRLPASQKANP